MTFIRPKPSGWRSAGQGALIRNRSRPSASSAVSSPARRWLTAAAAAGGALIDSSSPAPAPAAGVCRSTGAPSARSSSARARAAASGSATRHSAASAGAAPTPRRVVSGPLAASICQGCQLTSTAAPIKAMAAQASTGRQRASLAAADGRGGGRGVPAGGCTGAGPSTSPAARRSISAPAGGAGGAGVGALASAARSRWPSACAAPWQGRPARPASQASVEAASGSGSVLAGGSGAMAVRDKGFQLRLALRQVLGGGVQGAADVGGQFLARPALHHGQVDDLGALGVLGTEGGKTALHAVVLKRWMRVDRIAQAVGVDRRAVAVGGRHCARRWRAAPVRQQHVARNRPQPGGQLTVALELVDRTQGIEEGVLRQIVRRRLAQAAAPEPARQLGEVAAVQARQRGAA